MARPKGSPNKHSERPFKDALRAALAADNYKALRRVAESLIARAMDGDVAAIREVADRLDGKVPQGIAGPTGEGPMVLEVRWKMEGE